MFSLSTTPASAPLHQHHHSHAAAAILPPPAQHARHRSRRVQPPQSSTKSKPASASQQQPLDARGLSYLGDAIWTLCVRRHFFAPPKHWRSYQDMVQPYVTAEGQARMYDALLTGAAGATPQEQQLLRAVRTTAAGWRLRKRFDTPAAAEAYRKATAFEALVGHLHLQDPDRLGVLADGLMEHHSSLAQQQDDGQQQQEPETGGE